MSNELEIILVFLAGLIIGGCATGLLATIGRLQDRIRILQEAAQKRLPYRSADEIENAMAALNAIQFDLNFKQDMIDNARTHLAAARNPDGKK